MVKFRWGSLEFGFCSCLDGEARRGRFFGGRSNAVIRPITLPLP